MSDLAEAFVKKIVTGIPLQRRAVPLEQTILNVFENIVKSLDNNDIRSCIIKKIDYYYEIFKNDLLARYQQKLNDNNVDSTENVEMDSNEQELVELNFNIIDSLLNNNISCYQDEEKQLVSIPKLMSRLQLFSDLLPLAEGLLAINSTSHTQYQSFFQQSDNCIALSSAILNRIITSIQSGDYIASHTMEMACIVGYIVTIAMIHNNNTLISTLYQLFLVILPSNQSFFEYFLGYLGYWSNLADVKLSADITEFVSTVMKMLSSKVTLLPSSFQDSSLLHAKFALVSYFWLFVSVAENSSKKEIQTRIMFNVSKLLSSYKLQFIDCMAGLAPEAATGVTGITAGLMEDSNILTMFTKLSTHREFLNFMKTISATVLLHPNVDIPANNGSSATAGSEEAADGKSKDITAQEDTNDDFGDDIFMLDTRGDKSILDSITPGENDDNGNALVDSLEKSLAETNNNQKSDKKTAKKTNKKRKQ